MHISTKPLILSLRQSLHEIGATNAFIVCFIVGYTSIIHRIWKMRVIAICEDKREMIVTCVSTCGLQR